MAQIKKPAKKGGYVLDIKKYNRLFKKAHGRTPTVYETAELLGITYQTVNTLDSKPIKALGHLKRLSDKIGIPPENLIKKV